MLSASSALKLFSNVNFTSNMKMPLPLFTLVLFFPLTFALSLFKSSSHPVQARGLATRQAACETDPEWKVSPASWKKAGGDAALREWWTEGISRDESRLDRSLGESFGNGSDLLCGVGVNSSCSSLPCSGSSSPSSYHIHFLLTWRGFTVFQDGGDPVWAYLAHEGLVHLNLFLDNARVSPIAVGTERPGSD